MADEFTPRANSVTSGDQLMAGQAQQMIATFRRDHPTEFQEMVSEFDGRDANLAVFGVDRVNAHVANGTVTVQPGLATGDLASGAIYPEALQAIKRGVLT